MPSKYIHCKEIPTVIPARSGGQSTVNSRWSVEERLDFDACGSQLIG